MLTVVPSEVDAADPPVLMGQVLDDLPTVIETRVVDEDELVPRRNRWQYSFETSHQVR